MDIASMTVKPSATHHPDTHSLHDNSGKDNDIFSDK